MAGAQGIELVWVLKWTGLAEFATAILAGIGLGIGAISGL